MDGDIVLEIESGWVSEGQQGDTEVTTKEGARKPVLSTPLRIMLLLSSSFHLDAQASQPPATPVAASEIV